MNTPVLNFTVARSPETKYSDAQIYLREFAGRRFSRSDAEIVWSQVLDHKWHVSRRLERDIGLRAATVDFMENFYPAANRRATAGFSPNAGFFARTGAKLKKLARLAFEAKGQNINY